MRIPVTLSTVQIGVDADGHLDVEIDGQQPRVGDRLLTRADLPAVLDDITTRLQTAVRVEIREADGTTYSDIAIPPGPAVSEPQTPDHLIREAERPEDNRPELFALETDDLEAEDLQAGGPSGVGVPEAPTVAAALGGGGFRPGEEVALAYVVARQAADIHGAVSMRLPPALMAATHEHLMLIGLDTTARRAISTGPADARTAT